MMLHLFAMIQAEITSENSSNCLGIIPLIHSYPNFKKSNIQTKLFLKQERRKDNFCRVQKVDLPELQE